MQWYAAVEKAHLTKEQSKQLWSVVREHFDVCMYVLLVAIVTASLEPFLFFTVTEL